MLRIFQWFSCVIKGITVSNLSWHLTFPNRRSHSQPPAPPYPERQGSWVEVLPSQQSRLSICPLQEYLFPPLLFRLPQIAARLVPSDPRTTMGWKHGPSLETFHLPADFGVVETAPIHAVCPRYQPLSGRKACVHRERQKENTPPPTAFLLPSSTPALGTPWNPPSPSWWGCHSWFPSAWHRRCGPASGERSGPPCGGPSPDFLRSSAALHPPGPARETAGIHRAGSVTGSQTSHMKRSWRPLNPKLDGFPQESLAPFPWRCASEETGQDLRPLPLNLPPQGCNDFKKQMRSRRNGLGCAWLHPVIPSPFKQGIFLGRE